MSNFRCRGLVQIWSKKQCTTTCTPIRNSNWIEPTSEVVSLNILGSNCVDYPTLSPINFFGSLRFAIESSQSHVAHVVCNLPISAEFNVSPHARAHRFTAKPWNLRSWLLSLWNGKWLMPYPVRRRNGIREKNILWIWTLDTRQDIWHKSSVGMDGQNKTSPAERTWEVEAFEYIKSTLHRRRHLCPRCAVSCNP